MPQSQTVDQPMAQLGRDIEHRQLHNMPGSRRGGGGQGNHKNIGFLSNTGPDPLKNHKATKPAFNVGPSSTRQRNATEMAFRWRADDGR